MRGTVEHEIRRFARRVGWGRFLGATSQALALTALALAALLLVLRLFELAPTPDATWWALVAPALLVGLVRARRDGFGQRPSAAHLDRRLGLEGLLVTALERDTSAYDARLLARLADARGALPHLVARPMIARVLGGAVVLTAVLLLPAPARSAAQANPLTAETLAGFEAKLASLEEQEGLKEETREDLRRRLDDLQQDFARQGELTWTDLDALEQKMEHERGLQAARLAKAREDLAAFARGGDGRAAGTPAAERMAGLLEQAEAAGLLDTLPPALRERLGGGTDGAGHGGTLAGLDERALRQLAAAMAASADDALAGLEGAGLLDGVDLGDLKDLAGLLEGAPLDEPCRLCSGEPGDEDCPG